MSIELLKTLSLVFYILSGVLLLVSAALFFLLEVPKLIGDLSGATARKAIEKIRQQNEDTGEKSYQSSAVNKERGKTTAKISESGRLIHQPDKISGGFMNTEKLQQPAAETTVLDAGGAGETTVLGSSEAGETVVLNAGSAGETTVLNAGGAGETTVLAEPSGNVYPDSGIGYQPAQETNGSGVSVVVEAEMGFVGSAEIIE